MTGLTSSTFDVAIHGHFHTDARYVYWYNGYRITSPLAFESIRASSTPGLRNEAIHVERGEEEVAPVFSVRTCPVQSPKCCMSRSNVQLRAGYSECEQ